MVDVGRCSGSFSSEDAQVGVEGQDSPRLGAVGSIPCLSGARRGWIPGPGDITGLLLAQ